MLDWLRVDSLLWWWHTASLRQRMMVVASGALILLAIPMLWWRWSTPTVVMIPETRWESSIVEDAGAIRATPPAEPAPLAESAVACAPSGPIDLNTATVEQLDTLPGIGPVIAGRIIDWRDRNGRFTSVDELREVEGIGPVTWAKLSALVTV